MDDSPDIGAAFNINTIPCIKIYKNAQFQEEMKGTNVEQLDKLIGKYNTISIETANGESLRISN